MKLPAISLALTALVAGTAAQSLADLPKCAVSFQSFFYCNPSLFFISELSLRVVIAII